MVRHKNYSYQKLIEKLETLKSIMVVVENTNDIFERIVFGDLRNKAFQLSDGRFAYVNENKVAVAAEIINEIYKFDSFVYENFSRGTFDENFYEYLEKIILGGSITKKSIETELLYKFQEKTMCVTCCKQVFGLDIERCNFTPFSIGSFNFYYLPAGIKKLQEKFNVSDSFVKTMTNLEDGEWIFKTIEGYDVEKTKQLIESEINLFISALQFTTNEFHDTNVNLSNNIQYNHLNTFTFANFQLIKSQSRINNEVYCKRKLGSNDKEKYSKLWEIFEKPSNERAEMEKCILRAINWVAKSSVEPLIEVGITECFIALETLFNGEIENEKITETLCLLADKCLDKNKYNCNIKETIKKCYEARSQVVHGFGHDADEQLKSLMIVVAKDIITYLLNNYEHLSIETIKKFKVWVNSETN